MSLKAAIPILTIALPLLAPPAMGQQTIASDRPSIQDGRYGRGDEGWFFYKDPPESKTRPPIELPPPSESSPVKPPVLSAEWLRDNLDKYRFLAIDNPNRENVELYLMLQKLTMDKAEQFALASRAVAQQNPALDETVANPTSTFSRRVMSEVQEASQNEVTKKIGKRAGIYYFFQSTCQYCHQQNRNVPFITSILGVSVLPISLDGMPSTDGLLPNWRPDYGQGQYLGVTSTPTMYLVEPGGKVMLIANGVRSVPEIRERIIELALDAEWITRAEYDNAMRGLPRQFITDGLKDSELEDDPKKLLEVLRAASVHQKTETTFQQMQQTQSSKWRPKQ